jgi:hypothetical protein
MRIHSLIRTSIVLAILAFAGASFVCTLSVVEAGDGTVHAQKPAPLPTRSSSTVRAVPSPNWRDSDVVASSAQKPTAPPTPTIKVAPTAPPSPPAQPTNTLASNPTPVLLPEAGGSGSPTLILATALLPFSLYCILRACQVFLASSGSNKSRRTGRNDTRTERP